MHSPHWQTYIGTHLLGVESLASKSVDPIFPNLFRYQYDLKVDVELAEAIHDEASGDGLVMKMMRNPDFRVDYGTIVSCHMTDPKWTRPIVGVSSCRSTAFYSVEVMQEHMAALGRATRRAIEATGRRAVLLSSNSLSHRHFTTEAAVPEDMSREHIEHHGNYLWDMRILDLVRKGKTREMIDEMPEFITQSISEADGGGLAWLMGAMDYPTDPGEVYAYGTVIGTGNAVVGWLPGANS